MFCKLFGIIAAAAAISAEPTIKRDAVAPAPSPNWAYRLDLYDGLSLHGTKEHFSGSFGWRDGRWGQKYECGKCRDHTKPVDNRLYSFKFTTDHAYLGPASMYLRFYANHGCKDVQKPEFVFTGTKTVSVIPPDMVNASSHEVCMDYCPGKWHWTCGFES